MKLGFLVRTAVVIATLWFATAVPAEVVTFDGLDGYSNSTADGSYYDGYGFGADTNGWTTSEGLFFNTNQYGPGWSYSNVNNTTTAGYLNQFAAYPGSDATVGGNYLLGNTNGSNGAFFNLPTGRSASSVLVSNSTYAAISMRDGDMFAKDFGGPSGSDPDYFKLTFSGFNDFNAGGSLVGSVDFYLADFRFADNTQDYIVDSWQTVNLGSLTDAKSIAVSLETTDVGIFGANTPMYFAMDNLSLTAIPEPGVTLPALLGSAVLYLRRRR